MTGIICCMYIVYIVVYILFYFYTFRFILLKIFIFVFIFSEQIIGLFTTNPEVAKIGVDYLRLSSLEYFVLSVLFCVGGLITGAGFPMISLINTSISSFILRIPLAYLLSSFMGKNGVALSISIAPIGVAHSRLHFGNVQDLVD